MATSLVSPNPELNERIALFVKAADEIVEEYWRRNNFTYAPAPTHVAEYLSDKWVRIVTVESIRAVTERRVYAFIALTNYSTKALGQVKAGDIHKAATWKAPAKHARGNVFQEDFRQAMGPHGVAYLR